MLRSSRNNTPQQSRQDEAVVELAPHKPASPFEGSEDGWPITPSGQRRHGLLDIVNLMLEYDIQATHINSIGVPGSPEDHSTRPLVLGEGVTCLALQHELTEDAGGEDSGTKKGEIVVLKQYSERSYPSSTEAVGQDSKRPRAYDFLAQEIHVLRHERLRSHENIIRLLFLAYTPGNEMPLLGLELAEHGSLDFVLRCPGYGPSILDRENLTLDIALGLQALHACNIVHGDLKSENVLVFSHPRRHIVAKLADFGGSCFLDQDESRGSRRGDGPLHHTEIWDSPEVLIGDGSIDWQKSDVYSFGLVVASLWMRTSTHQPWPLDPQFSTCVLEPLVQRSWYNGLPSWLAALKIWKLRRDSDDNSLVSEVSRFLKWTLEKEGSAIPFVLSLVQKTLKTLPYERSVILRTLHDMEGTCISPEVGDRLSNALRLNVVSHSDSVKPNNSGLTQPRGSSWSLKVWSQEYFETPFHWKATILDHLLKQVEPLELLDNGNFEGYFELTCTHDTTDQDFIEMVQIVTRRLFYLSAATTTLGVEGAQHAGQIALHAAFSLLLGLGTEISGTEGGKWLCYSALCGNVIAICTLSEIYDVFPGFLEGVERLVPLDIFLSLTALAGSNSVLAKLEIRNQHFASHVKSLRQSLDITAIALARLKAKAAPFLAGLVMAYCASAVSTAEPDVMADAIRTRNVEEILHAAEIRLGLVGLETGASLRSDALHYLSYFCDPMSAQLASKLVDSGAKLDYKLGMGSLSTLNRIKQAFGTAEWTEGRALARPSENPLLRAVNQANVSLAMALIDLHEIHGVPLVMPLLSLTKAASLHLSAVVGRLLSLGKQKPLLCNLQQADWAPGTVGLGAYPPEVISLLAEQITITTENVLGSCALLVMRPYGNIYFRRLAIHGRDAPRRETEVLEVILDALQDAGVDAWPAYFKCCLAWDLVNPLKAGMDRLRKAGCDPLPVMARVFSPKPLLKSCVTHRAYQCLQELVSNSTLLVQQDSIGLTALHTVAAADDRVALRILMNAGGRQLADIKSFNGESAIDFAVYSGNTDIATTIYDAEINTTAQSFSALRPSTARISTDTFVRLVLNWRRNRSVKLLDSLRWLFQNAPCCPLRARKMQPLSENDMRLAIADEVEGGGQDFPPVCPQDWEEIVTIWHEIISTPFCGPANQMSLDRLFLCELFARFPRHVSFVDCKGWTSLHLAVWNGHVAAVELLLALGVDVNSETDPRPGRPPHIRGLASFFPGRTALNLATEALMRSPPLAVESAGYAEIVEWGARLRAIIRLLARNGAASGSGAGKREVVAAERFTKPNVRVNFYGLQAIESRRQRITYSGVWPQTIINRTPSAVSEKDAVTWWSNSCPVTSDYFDGEYGVWPDLPWLGTVDEINERQEAEAAQVARLSGLIAAKRVLSTKSDIRVTANGSVCMFDTNEEIWWEETEWRETTAESMLDVEGLDLNK